MGGQQASQYGTPVQSLSQVGPYGARAPTSPAQVQQLLGGNLGGILNQGPTAPPGGGVGFQGPGVGGGGMIPGSGNPMAPGAQGQPAGGMVSPPGLPPGLAPGPQGQPAPGGGVVSPPGIYTGPGMRGQPAPTTPAPQPTSSAADLPPGFLQSLQQQMQSLQKNIGQGNVQFQPLTSQYGPGQSPMGRPSWQAGVGGAGGIGGRTGK